LENSHFSFSQFSALLDEDFEKQFLYTKLIEKYNTIPARTQVSFEAIPYKEEV